MRGPALLDVNVLVALFDPDHVHHDLAHDWFGDSGARSWATCPLTENGFVRVVSNPRYRADPVRVTDALALLRKFCASRGHRFWPAGLSLRDTRVFVAGFAAGPSQITDIFLLGLARKHGGSLATFDRGIPLAAVKGATPDHLCVIEAA
jgi:toxin-antitoxin system PIN domain toxin